MGENEIKFEDIFNDGKRGKIKEFIDNQSLEESIEECNVFSDRPTPILRGDDAFNFYKRLKENENKKISSDDLKKIKETAEMLNKILEKSNRK